MSLLLNRYTIIGSVVLIVLAVLWLQFGGLVSSWSAGVYKAVTMNREAEAKLLEAQKDLAQSLQESQRVLREHEQSQAAVRSLSRQLMEFKQRSDQAVAKAREKDVLIASLQGTLKKLEAERKALAPVANLEEAKRALEKFHPAYR